MIDRKELYFLFKKCFLNYYISEKNLFDLIGMHECNLVIERDSALIGISIIYRNTILLLMVDPAYQNKGIGTKLLEQSEQFIVNQNYKNIFLGSGTDKYLFPGVPFQKEEHLFFEKRGYVNRWDCHCLDLVKRSKDFSKNVLLGSCENGIYYDCFNENDRDFLEKAILESGQQKWIDIYRRTKGLIIVAKENKKIIGFMIYEKSIVYPNKISENIGGFGCIGVIPSYRNQGIAKNLVFLGENKLLLDNVDGAFLGYTYLEDYYKKLGYQPDKYYWMGEKRLL